MNGFASSGRSPLTPRRTTRRGRAMDRYRHRIVLLITAAALALGVSLMAARPRGGGDGLARHLAPAGSTRPPRRRRSRPLRFTPSTTRWPPLPAEDGGEPRGIVRQSPDGRRTSPSRARAWFHNGDPVTAEDVKFSYERYRGTGPRSSRRGPAGGYRRSPDGAFLLKEPLAGLHDLC